MDLLSESSLVIRLVVAAILGGIIGIEREIMNRTAGLRTHVMVSIGATLFTVLSIYFFDYDHGPRDPARIAAQIVSGIGFLGAGSIMKHGASVQGRLRRLHCGFSYLHYLATHPRGFAQIGKFFCRLQFNLFKCCDSQ